MTHLTKQIAMNIKSCAVKIKKTTFKIFFFSGERSKTTKNMPFLGETN